ncbi:DUF3127 domain-containing protein [Tenuifilum sp.]|uniref:DUF3127 domain-containing protein n=1 Tax=Tenuifilum sp. TaxID=2760880 RepID=UPI002CA9B7E0|nr:DUF3127 domain-containing protein [Tenuifilum sp.]HQE55702.1 DUF3127 domain-containing protein [Tenuifilum sp.]
MEIQGKLIKKLDQQTGHGKNGAWVKQEFIIETQEQYPRKICISLWGDKVRELDPIQEGSQIKVAINIESREFNGRWYTDVRAWRIEPMSKGATPEQAPELPPFNDNLYQPMEGGSDDDLPF